MTSLVEQLAFQPPFPPFELPDDRTIWLSNEQGDQIPAVYYHYPKSMFVIVYSHGNAIDLGRMAPFYAQLSKILKTSVLGYEYLGYGFAESQESRGGGSNFNCWGSTCTPSSSSNYPSEKGCLRSLRAVYTYLTGERKISARKIILMGQSIGTGPTVSIASQLPVGGVILVSPFRSVARVVTENSLARLVDIFDNQAKVKNIEVPTLIVHGIMDEVVPWQHGHYLAQLLAESSKTKYPPAWIAGADHNNVINSEDFYQVLQNYLEHLFYRAKV